MTKQKVVMVDPPSGWLFGFPKPLPTDLEDRDKEDWFIHEGYPIELIDQGMLKHCRYWTTEIDQDD